MKYLSIISAVSVSAFLISGCRDRDVKVDSQEFNWPSMGTYGNLIVRGENRDAALETAKLAFEEVNSQLSVFVKTSDIAQLNAKAGSGEFVKLGKHAWKMALESKRYFEESEGAFNPAVGPLMEAWGFFRGGDKNNFPPAEGVIVQTLPLCDFNAAEMRGDGEMRLGKAGMRLDFGAIAKGCGVDVAFDRLIEAGRKHFMVNMGGNMRCAGRPEDGADAWRIAVRDPRSELEGVSLGTLLLTDGMAVATSGNYEQFFEMDGKRYTHIMDARTGMPVSGMAQVTVVAKSAAEADALSTTCFVLGREKSEAVLAKHPGSGAMFVKVDESGGLTAETAGDFLKWFKPEKTSTDEQ